MCQDKKSCSCGCSTKKPLKEAKEKKVLKEGTWAPHIWSKSLAIRAKNILQGIIDDPRPDVDVSRLLKKFENVFYNAIGDDHLYDLIDQAALEYRKKRPTWKPRLTAAIARINQLESSYVADGKISESIERKKQLLEKINLKLTSNTKIELVKQAKIALDAVYMIYDKAEKREVSHDGFLNIVDETFEKISELLAVLIGQESVELPIKK